VNSTDVMNQNGIRGTVNVMQVKMTAIRIYDGTFTVIIKTEHVLLLTVLLSELHIQNNEKGRQMLNRGSSGNVLVNGQLDAQFFFLICLFQSSTCFEQPCAHHQENQLYQYKVWYMSPCVGVGVRGVCRSGRNLCVKLVIYQNYTEMHSQQNIKNSGDVY
jgi:hypothetical protein